MSFQLELERMTQQLNSAAADYKIKSDNLPLQLEKIIEANQKKLSIFIENFQNQILTLKKAEQRDCKIIDNMRFENQQRRSQNNLLKNATKMQQGILSKMKSNISSMGQTIKQYEARMFKHQENLNRNLLDIDELMKNRKPSIQNMVQVDKQNSKLIVRVDNNGGKVYEINYMRKDDRFTTSSNDKSVIQVIAEFNFHRDLNKLYRNLLRFS